MPSRRRPGSTCRRGTSRPAGRCARRARRSSRERREVDPPGDDRRRAGDRPVRRGTARAPPRSPRRSRRSDASTSPRTRGRARRPSTSRRSRPSTATSGACRSRRRTSRPSRRSRRCRRGRRRPTASRRSCPRAPNRGWAFACPEHVPARRVQRVDVARVVADEEAVARDRDAALHLPLQLRRPSAPCRCAAATPRRGRSSRRRRPSRRRRAATTRTDRSSCASAHCPSPTAKAISSPVSLRARRAVAGRRVQERLVDDMAVDRRRRGDAAV